MDGGHLENARFAVPGSDTAELLRELDIADEEVEKLRASGAVFTDDPA